MEKMDNSHRRTKDQYFRFLRAWRSAGFPRKFKWDPKTGRIATVAELREGLNAKSDETAKLRGENEYRRKMMKLNK